MSENDRVTDVGSAPLPRPLTGEYMGAIDLLDDSATGYRMLTRRIIGVEEREVRGSETVPVLDLFLSRPIILNNVNLQRLEDDFGTPDTGDWIGRTVDIWVEQSQMAGRATVGLRVGAHKGRE